jgi:hypothetical protein
MIEPVTTMEQLAALDDDAIVQGYRDGFHDRVNYTRRDQAYWHGYLNGQCDSGAIPVSGEQKRLARAYVDAIRAMEKAA